MNRLALIEESLRQGAQVSQEDQAWLLCEAKRLRAALVELGSRVANPWDLCCRYCRVSRDPSSQGDTLRMHRAYCPWRMARELVDAAQPSGSAASG